MHGRPHYSTDAGGHLYYSATGEWYLSTSFSPNTTLHTAAIAAAGEVPLDETPWRYWSKDQMFVLKNLTVEEPVQRTALVQKYARGLRARFKLY